MEFNLKELLKGFKDEIRKTSKKSKVSDKDFEEIWTQVTHKLENEPPPRVAIIGNTGVGKSSTLNALFNAGQPISHTKACTQVEGIIEITADTVEGEKGFLVIYDMPGLDESISSQEKHLETYERILKDVDVAIWVLEAASRGIKNVQDTIDKDIRRINPEILNRIVFALNKVDLVHPGATDWNPLANLPSDEQLKNITMRIEDVESKIKEILPDWQGKIIGYSADKRYNLTKLFSTMLDSVPETRKWVITSRKALSDYLELVDERLLPDEFKIKKQENAKLKSKRNQENLLKIIDSMTPDELKEFVQNNESIFSSLNNSNQDDNNN